MDWDGLVRGIQQTSRTSIEQFFCAFSGSFRRYFIRKFGGQDVDDLVHSCLVTAVEAVQRTSLEPAKLRAYVWTIARRQGAAHISRTIQQRREDEIETHAFSLRAETPTSEDLMWRAQQAEIARRLIKELKPREREILRRFYAEEQTQEDICREMDLTQTQFRLLKSRAKARFTAMCQGAQTMRKPQSVRASNPSRKGY